MVSTLAHGERPWPNVILLGVTYGVRLCHLYSSQAENYSANCTSQTLICVRIQLGSSSNADSASVGHGWDAESALPQPKVTPRPQLCERRWPSSSRHSPRELRSPPRGNPTLVLRALGFGGPGGPGKTNNPECGPRSVERWFSPHNSSFSLYSILPQVLTAFGTSVYIYISICLLTVCLPR